MAIRADNSLLVEFGQGQDLSEGLLASGAKILICRHMRLAGMFEGILLPNELVTVLGGTALTSRREALAEACASQKTAILLWRFTCG